MQGDQAADAELLLYYEKDSKDITLYTSFVAKCQEKIDHFDRELYGIHGSPDEILARIPEETAYDKAIIELSKTEAFYTTKKTRTTSKNRTASNSIKK